MGLRLALLISAALLLAGCVKARSAAEAREGCASCHAPHYTDAGACEDCHRGEPSAARTELAHARLLSGKAAEYGQRKGPAVSEGRTLVEGAGCRRCHTIGGEGSHLATNLDSVVWKREQSELLTSITQPVDNMPAFDFDRGQAEAVIAFLLGGARPDATDDAYRVQFARDASRSPSAFEDKCGGCHRLLTSQGPRGFGKRGPNLSGLLTPFYPRTAPNECAWTGKTVSDWLANPRAARPNTIMPPVPLSEAELRQVLESIRDSGGPVR
ncbi:MAG: c-type cytochrome [Vicinamibacteria bacterium]|nr:c-type cytochrome [Vicinamibacteria bacterium]